MSEQGDDRERGRRQQANWQEEFVGQLYRLFKVSRIHDLGNEAAQSALEQTAVQFREMLQIEGVDYMDVIFAGDNIFVNGKPLRASREVYHTVMELGDLLGEIDLNEVTITPGITEQALSSMLEVYLRRRENPDQRSENVMKLGDSVRLRLIDPKKLLDIDEEADQTAEEQVLKLYPAAVVTMRRFHQQVRHQEFRGLRFIKRVSQRLVALSDSAAETLLAMSSMRKTRDDEGGISVNAGVLAMLVGRHVTDSYRTLQRLCYSAMVAEIGRPRAAGIYNRREVPNVIPKLNMSGKEQLGPSNALLILRNGQLREPTLRRAAIAYEAGWLRYEHDIGWPYGNDRRPSIESFIVRVCHRFWDLMALKPSMNQRRTPEEVFDTLLEEADSRVEQAVVRLVMETLAFYERGAIVETSEGWRGVVVEPGQTMADFPRPVVRMVRDANNNAINPQDLDLSDPDIDFTRFGLVRQQLRNVNDERLLKVARELRPGDWNQKHATPSKKPRERRNPRSTPSSSNQSAHKTDQSQKRTPEESSPTSNSAASSGQRPSPTGANRSSDSRDDSRPAGGTSQSFQARRRESTETSSPHDPSVVLEFGPGGPPGAGESAESQKEAEETPRADGGSSDEELPELSPEAIEPSEHDEPSDDEIADLSPDQIDPVDQQPASRETNHPEEPAVGPQDATQQMSREEASEKLEDFVEREQQDADQADQQEGLLRDYVDSVEDEQQVDGGPSSGEGHLGEPTEASGEDATRQMDSEQSASVLEDFVQETASDEQAAPEGATRQVDAEQSHQMLQDYVDEPEEPPESEPTSTEKAPDEGRLGSLATDMSEDTSPEEISRTERVSSERSHELMRDFVEETPTGEQNESAEQHHGDDRLGSLVAEEQEADPENVESTEAISSEKSKELLRDFIDSEQREQEQADDDATRQISSEHSAQVLQDYVEDDDS